MTSAPRRCRKSKQNPAVPTGPAGFLHSGLHWTAVECGDIAAVAPRAYFFCLARKSGQKEALDADRIVPQATEQARRRTLRPAHGNPSTKLNYSAACVETTLPSETVATQGKSKTPCRGNNGPSTYAPMVPNICRADVHPQGVGRIRSAPSSLTAALAIGPYDMLCMSTTRRVFRK